jgi:hypothetical protein
LGTKGSFETIDLAAGSDSYFLGLVVVLVVSNLQDHAVSKEKSPSNEKTRAARARQQVIGRELRRIFDTVVQEPVPDEFLDLLKKMDAAADDPSEKGSI